MMLPHLISTYFLVISFLISSALNIAIAGSSNDTSVSACYAPDREALVSFARVAGFFNDDNYAWHGDDCCSWNGITCSNATAAGGGEPRRVTGIYVEIDSTVPVIPTSLCNLSALSEVLVLVYVGTFEPNISIPECVGTHLMLLNTFGLLLFPDNEELNSGTLNIPASFSLLSTLQSLVLRCVRIDSQSLHHILSLPSLVQLSLGFCPLVSSSLIPVFTTPHTLSNLTFLALIRCSLSGPLPPFTNMPLLQELHLQRNSLNSPLEDFILHSNISALKFLDLSFNSLSGTIPTSTSQQLPHLEVLDLQSNNLSGPLPHRALHLKNLTYLLLGDNRFSGSFPDLINSPLLDYIDLSNNHFIGGLPENWQHLSRLAGLLLSGNSISSITAADSTTRRLPDWLFRLPLAMLGLAYTGLQERDCGCHGMLSLLNETLFSLNVAGNNFAGPDIFNCFALYNRSSMQDSGYLNFSGNPLAFSLSTNYFPNVSVLDMSHCHLFGSLPAQLITDSSLTILNLSFNNFTGLTHPGKAHGKTHKRHSSYNILNLSHNSISADISSLIDQLGLPTCGGDEYSESCHTFDVSHNKLTGEISARASTWLSGFWRVLLNDNQLVGNIPPEFGLTTYDSANQSIHKLATLRLNNNRLVGSIPTSILNITSMYFLDLSYNELEGNFTALIFSSMKQPTQLRVLLLSHNRIQGSIPASFGSLTPSLQVIDLSHNKLSGVIPSTLQLPTFTQSSTTTISSLYEEYAMIGTSSFMYHQHRRSSTSSPGRLPEELQVVVKGVVTLYVYELLTLLTLLDLSNNSLSGAIPSQFGKFTSLLHLNLSRNMLSESIPATLSNMHALESMDLSFNQLEGEIPSSFSKLTFLGTFNVSFNRGLKGQIPSGSAFENSTSFIGDPHLCGLHVLGACSESEKSNRYNNDKDEYTFFTWMRDYVALPGLMLGLVFGFVGTMWMLHAECSALRAFTRMWHVLM